MKWLLFGNSEQLVLEENEMTRGVSKYLGDECEKEKRYFIINNKKVPILRMGHTFYYQGKIEPLPEYANI